MTNLFPSDTLSRIIAYMKGKNMVIHTGENEANIVYVEGMNTDGSLNDDKADGWNDLCLVFDYTEGQPRVLHCSACTTEPGVSATFSKGAKLRGGVARIAFGQYFAWRMGYHKERKYGKAHPALVQAGPIPVHRDANMDGKRTGDKVDIGRGINQHGTREGELPEKVGMWSEGCLVRRDWADHLHFLQVVSSDSRYKKNRRYLFGAAFLDGGKF